MQTMESILSLLFLVSISSMILGSFHPCQIDDSLYSMQLASDAWQILVLRGDLQDYSDAGASRAVIESDLVAIGRETSLCVFIEGLRITNCRGGEGKETVSTIRKTLIVDGRPKTVTLTIGI